MSGNDFVVTRRPPEQHAHKLPGWRWRRKHNIKCGTVIECVTCKKQYEWTYDEGGYWSGFITKPIPVDDGPPGPPPPPPKS